MIHFTSPSPFSFLLHFSCADLCPPLTLPIYVTASTADNHLNVTVTFKCDDGYSLVGDAMTTCSWPNGVWSPRTVPQCTKSECVYMCVYMYVYMYVMHSSVCVCVCVCACVRACVRAGMHVTLIQSIPCINLPIFCGWKVMMALSILYPECTCIVP